MLEVLLHLAVIHLLMAMLPGPNTVLVGYLAASDSRRSGILAAAGVMLATLMWVSLSLAGIGILLAQASEVYRALRLVGAAYLLYVGARMLWSGLRPRATVNKTANVTVPRQAGLTRRGPFVAGILTTLGNPKAAVFWTSVFALVVPSDAPSWFYAAVPALVTVQSALWYGFLALIFSSPPARRHYGRIGRWLDLAAGSVMIALGLKVADEVRQELAANAIS